MDFKIGHTSLSNFFKQIAQRPSYDYAKPWLSIGEIKLFDCTAGIEDDIKTHEIIDSIYHKRFSLKAPIYDTFKKAIGEKLGKSNVSSSKSIR